jgi:hypothetical protein
VVTVRVMIDSIYLFFFSSSVENCPDKNGRKTNRGQNWTKMIIMDKNTVMGFFNFNTNKSHINSYLSEVHLLKLQVQRR